MLRRSSRIALVRLALRTIYSKNLRILIHFAIDLGWRTDDPVLRIKKFAEGEFHTWTEEEISIFEKRWAARRQSRA